MQFTYQVAGLHIQERRWQPEYSSNLFPPGLTKHVLNPQSPNSDQHQISPHHISAL